MNFTPEEKITLSTSFSHEEYEVWLGHLKANNWRLALLSYLNLNKGWQKNRDKFWKLYEYFELVPKKLAQLIILDLQEKKLRRTVWRADIA